MRFTIRHETVYRYSAPVNYTIQLLRLTPRADRHQRRVAWTIDAPGTPQRQVDAFGNLVHLLTVTQPHDAIRVSVKGVVDVDPLTDGRLASETGAVPPLAYAVATPRTMTDAAIEAFVAQSLPRGLDKPGDALRLAMAIADRVPHKAGTTTVSHTAADALALGHGVCQDHAHLFLACCHALGVPARYVSGYMQTDGPEEQASHAWADVWFDGSGWVSVDVSHGRFASDRHCRLAVGRDYESAGPVRGVRSGGGEETMSVEVEVGAPGQ